MTMMMMDRTTTGPLKVNIHPAGLAAGHAVTAVAGGYRWHVIADDAPDGAPDGAPRVRVVCHGRDTAGPFPRWNYPRADMWEAVGRAVVVALTGAARVELEAIPGPFVGRAPVPEDTRNSYPEFGRFFLLTDIF